MNIALKKIELIEWLARVKDETVIEKIDSLKNDSLKKLYEHRMPKTLADIQAKLDRSETDITEGKLLAQETVEAYFKARFDK